MGLKAVFKRVVRLPMFTALTVVTLALGIGANSAIFSVIEGVLLKPLPYRQPDQLVTTNHVAPGVNIPELGTAAFLYLTYRDEKRAFQDVAMWQMDTVSVTGLAEPEEVPSLNVTESLLPILGVPAAFGRVFTPKDDSPGAPNTVVLTYQYWQARFGGSSSAIGQTLHLDGNAYEIIGVLPASFQFLDRKPSVLLPLRIDRSKVLLGQFNFQGLGRLNPGGTIEQARADATRMIALSLTRYPPPPGFSLKMFHEARLGPLVQPLKENLTGNISTVLWVLMGTVGLVLLIACANVANLLLVRVEGRQHEMAIRAALGANRGQLARELLLESVILGLLGGVLGLAFAYGALRMLLYVAPAQLPRLESIGIDPTVLIFTLAISLLAGLLFGTIPIVKFTGAQINTALRSEGRAVSASKERHRARSTLVIVQVALTLVLLISAGLMIRTFQALRHVQPGFTEPEHLLTLRISLPDVTVKEADAVVRMHKAIADKIATIAGVYSVSLAGEVPMSGSGWHDPIYAEDHVYAEGTLPPIRLFKFATPGLYQTMGNKLVAGRDFTWAEIYDARPVVMVSENLARELWHDPANALGKRIRESSKNAWREVIGVVGDERFDGVDQKPPAAVIHPIRMEGFEGGEHFVKRTLSYIIRSNRAGSQGLMKEVSQAVWSINPNLPLADVRTMREIYDKSLARTSFTLVMLAIAGGMALLLGIAGLYGVIAYSVSQRTREIGIRVALGAQKSEVTRMFVRHGALLAAVGIVLGLSAAFAVTRVMSTILFEISPLDPFTYIAVSSGLAAAAILASYVPALRATSVDPIKALRAD